MLFVKNKRRDYGFIIYNIINMSLTYSKYFKVKHRDFLQKGVYNASLDQDSLLHIDPLLLKEVRYQSLLMHILSSLIISDYLFVW